MFMLGSLIVSLMLVGCVKPSGNVETETELLEIEYEESLEQDSVEVLDDELTVD